MLQAGACEEAGPANEEVTVKPGGCNMAFGKNQTNKQQHCFFMNGFSKMVHCESNKLYLLGKVLMAKCCKILITDQRM